VWSLVWGPVLASGLTLLLAHAYAGYLPRPVFDRRAARRLAGFGGTLAAKNVFVHLSRYADHLAVGRLLGAGALGLYSRARNYSSTPDTRLLPMLHSVFFPAFARVRTDHDRFIEWFSKAMTLAAVVSAPLLLGGLALAHDFTVALLGPQWVGMVPALQVLCVAGLIDAVHRLGTAAIEAAGKLRYEVVPQVVYAVLIFGGSVAGARLGIEGVAWAMLVAAAAFYLMQGFAIRAAVGVPWRVYAGAGLPAVAAAAIMAGVVRLAAGLAGAEWSDGGAHESLTRLAAGITAGVVSYPLLLALVAPSQARMLLDQIAHLRAGHARRTQALRDGHGVVRAGEL
jgi:O-antigen/teichoic acid export membrane protein